MVATHLLPRLDELAQTLFGVLTKFGLSVPRIRRRGSDLKEVEFLTLAILQEHDTLIVGDIQRQLGVLPAQMSRILRALETRDRPLIACRINPQDKRKVDVALTAAGLKALRDYQTARIQQITALLTRLADDDLDDLQRLLERFNEAMSANGWEAKEEPVAQARRDH
jgi:DNA-binding MarR family transcriptional regulator